MYDIFILTCNFRHHHRHDACTWGDRIRTREKKWVDQLDDLADAYCAGRQIHLKWKVRDLPSLYSMWSSMVSAIFLFLCFPPLMIAIDYSASKSFTHITSSKSWNATLLEYGCLSCMPDVVMSVVSLRTLELYWGLHLHHAPLSVQAWIKVICDLHDVGLLCHIY